MAFTVLPASGYEAWATDPRRGWSVSEKKVDLQRPLLVSEHLFVTRIALSGRWFRPNIMEKNDTLLSPTAGKFLVRLWAGRR